MAQGIDTGFLVTAELAERAVHAAARLMHLPDFFLARGGYGPNPLMVILVTVCVVIVGGTLIAVGRAASSRKIESRNKHQAGQDAADDFVRGLMILLFAGYLIYWLAIGCLWLFNFLFG